MAEQKLLAEQQKEKELELQYNKEQEKFKNRYKIEIKYMWISNTYSIHLEKHNVDFYFLVVRARVVFHFFLFF